MARNGSVIFYTHAMPRRTLHPARKCPNRSIPMVSLMGIFPAPLCFKTPTDIASHEAGEEGVLAVRQDGSSKGRRPAQIAGPTGCRIGGLGRFRKGRSARLTDVFAQQIHKCALASRGPLRLC